MPNDGTPSLRKNSFICPHCGALAQQAWAECFSDNKETGENRAPGLWVSECFACREDSFWRTWEDYTATRVFDRQKAALIYPVAQTFGPARHGDMPKNVAQLYDEASTVANLSPRSASALLRLSLEVLLDGLYPDAGNLNKKIKAAVSAGLPKQVQQTMDVLRFNGNESVHKFHHDDTAETASTMFTLLNIVVEQLISQPKRLAELYEGLPEGFRDQVERRDTAKVD